MTLPGVELAPLSWDDLLSAISPRQEFDGADLQRAIHAVVVAEEAELITADEAAEIIQMMLAIAASGQVNAMVDDFFTPDSDGDLGAGVGPRIFSHI